MNRPILISAISIALLGSAAVLAQGQPQQPQQPMSFFATSAPPGTGNLGGLEGADKICQDLAAAAGAGNKTWHAYLSQEARGGVGAVNARGRIGTGPWYNAKGQLIANNVADLHGDIERDRTHSARQAVASNVLRRQGSKLGIDLDQRDLNIGHADRQCEAGGTNPRALNDQAEPKSSGDESDPCGPSLAHGEENQEQHDESAAERIFALWTARDGGGGDDKGDGDEQRRSGDAQKRARARAGRGPRER